MMNIYDEFQWRGMLYEATPELREVLAENPAFVAAQLFASLPAHISCPAVLPDIATETVTAVSHGSRHSVTVRGGCNRRFDRVYAALTRAVGSP